MRRLASEGTRPYLPWAVRVEGLAARRHCAGLHALELQVNGIRHGRLKFILAV